jgi:glycine amidinotransferase/scyllo-inosamine-4-phosphate amidinotransferase 1
MNTNIKVESWNEWDELETVIIGRADGARIPRLDKSLQAINYADEKNPSQIPVGPYPSRVIDEANEDLETLCSELRKLNVNVLRPEDYDTSKVISNGHWQTEGYYSFCPRDSVLVHGSTIIEAPMPLRARYLEQQMFRSIFNQASENGATWISAPRPALNDDCYELENIDKTNLTLREVEPCFDAANVLRCGYDLFYLVSNSGNLRGAQWLQNTLGEKFKIHLLRDVYAYMHVDSTISFIKPGLVLLNPSRMNEKNIPDVLKGWDKIWAADPVDIGYFKNYKNASHWIGMNLLMVRPDLAVVEKNQLPLIKQLEQKGIDVLALPMRHARTLGGAFHCVSLDLKRKSKLENYF